MKEIKFVTRRRGFFSHLENNKNSEIKFSFLENSFEVPSVKRTIMSKLIRSKLADFLGIIQEVSYNQKESDQVILGSFNRFLKTNHNYLIYLENPTALFHYTLNRNKTFLGRRKFSRFLSNNNLKYFICMSSACEQTITEVFKPNVSKVETRVIYPLVKNNNFVNIDTIKNKQFSKQLKLLFIAQGSRFISKGGLEIIEVMKQLEKENIVCTIITNVENLSNDIKNKIMEAENIELINFNLNYNQMEEIYSRNDVLLHPSSDDSFGLTVLEAMKAGLPIISSNLYAFPEMVLENQNGFMVDPKWHFFDKNGIPNPEVWNNRKKTLYSEKISENIVSFLKSKILIMFNNPEKRIEMSVKSYELSMQKPFSEDYILNQWAEVYEDIKCKNDRW